MQFSASLLALGAFSGLVSAQYSINPNSVPQSLRQYWCDSQITQCPLICLQYNGSTGAIANDCDSSNLSYECVCSTGISPNASEYSQTLPYFVCTEWGNQCVTACAGSSSCADDCRTKHPCGARNPTRVNSTTASTMAATGSTTGSGGATQTFGAFGSASSSSIASAKYTAQVASIGNKFGFVIVASGIVGGLALLL
ncbi:hypothetical protein BDZ85DRAFT_135155 [Elsinoe ampelina]|uniref:DUF7707 domain-containing protein n=1 Tax=Elsinoe ampelina TaxID=302913 RepID=A0A6A6G8M7_9PEZI|nr:hypothetical protein BDZ85DRAFT_135155 [Elsinoe ampelina]